MQRNKSRNTESKVRITIANSSSFQQLGINLKNEKKSVKELADFIFQVDNDLQSKIITPIQQVHSPPYLENRKARKHAVTLFVESDKWQVNSSDCSDGWENLVITG